MHSVDYDKLPLWRKLVIWFGVAVFLIIVGAIVIRVLGLLFPR